MPTREQYTEVIKRAAFKIVLDAAIKQIVSKIPFFSLAIPNYLMTIVVTKLLTIVFELVELGIFFTYIDMRTANEANDFEKAALRNALAQAGTNEQEKIYAEKSLIDSFRKFAKLV